jgi:hypothetical protein
MASPYAPTVLAPGSLRGARRLPFRDVVLLSSWFRSPSASRDPELRLCFWLNSQHSGFTRRVWFVEEKDAAEARAAVARGELSGDIVALPPAAAGRLRYGDAFRYARDRLPENSVCVLANSDIAIPAASAALLASLAALPRVAVCLTRHEADLPPAAARRLAADHARLAPAEAWAALTRRTHIMDARRGSRSQDVWVWHNSLRPSLARLDAIPLGKPGCDNALAHHLGTDARARILNPCLAAPTYHLHASRVRTYTGRDRIPPPYAGVPFTLLPGDPGAPPVPPAPRTAAATPAPPVFLSRRTSRLHASRAPKAARPAGSANTGPEKQQPSRAARLAAARALGPVFVGYV